MSARHRVERLLTVALLVVFSLPIWAEGMWRQVGSDTYHYFAFSAGGGYYALLENIEEVRTTGGGAGVIGLGYELRRRGFSFSAGLDLQYGGSTMQMSPFEVHRLVWDTQGKEVNYHYAVNKWSDTQLDLRVGVPVLFGFYTNGIYGAIGGRFSYSPRVVSVPAMTYVTTGTYVKYISDFANMPDHFYGERTTHGSGELHMQPQGSVMAEIGYDILNKERMSNYIYCSVLKIAVFAEYGINNSLRGNITDEECYTVNEQNPTLLVGEPYYARRKLEGARIVPLFVGVKLTYLLRIRTKNCNCF